METDYRHNQQAGQGGQFRIFSRRRCRYKKGGSFLITLNLDEYRKFNYVRFFYSKEGSWFTVVLSLN